MLYDLPTYTSDKAKALLGLALVELLLLGHALAQILTAHALRAAQATLPAVRPPWIPDPRLVALPLGVALLALLLFAPRFAGIAGKRPFLLLAFAAQLLALAYPVYQTRPLIALWLGRGEVPAPHGGAAALAVLGAARLVTLLVEIHRLRRLGHTHGSAHFADVGKALAAGLATRPPGIPLGRLQDTVLYLPDALDVHHLTLAASGAGKTSSLIIPGIFAALDARHSLVVFDIKGELFEKTSGAAGRTHRVLRWSPAHAASPTRYNPLSLVPRGPGDVEGAQIVAEMLCNPDGTQKTSDFWVSSARSLLTAVILHQVYTAKDPCLCDLWQALNPPAGKVQADFKRAAETPHDPKLLYGLVLDGAPSAVHPVVAAELLNFCDLAAETSSGILKTALSFLDLYADSTLRRSTGVSDFRPEDLQSPGSPPTILYLHVPSNQIARTRPLVRLALRQILTVLLSESLAVAGRRPLHLFLDEFPQLGPFPFLQQAIAVTRSFRIFFRIAVQTLSQIRALYGQDESITPNCRALHVFGISDLATAEHFSRLLGNTTLHLERTTTSAQARGGSGSSTTMQDLGRPLLTADELRRLPSHLAILLLGGVAPLLLERIPCFTDPKLLPLLALPPAELPVPEA